MIILINILLIVLFLTYIIYILYPYKKKNVFENFVDSFLWNFGSVRENNKEKKLDIAYELLMKVRNKLLLQPMKKPSTNEIRKKLIEYHSQVILDGKVDGKEKWIEAVVDKFLGNEDR